MKSVLIAPFLSSDARRFVGVRKFVETKIAQANKDDASDILELQRISYQKEAALYDDWTIPPLTQTLPEIQAEFENHVFLKALSSAGIIGSVRALPNYCTCKIGRLIVHPDYQGMGIGSLLMKHIETFFPDAKRFELFTGSKSFDNIRRYKKLGYGEYCQQNLSKNVRIVFLEKLR